MKNKNRGEIVKQRVIDRDVKFKLLYKKLDVSRTTLHNYFVNEDLDFDIILKIGEIIDYDFSIDFPELEPITSAKEGAPDYKVISLPECLKQRNEWKSKYYDLLEKYTHLLESKGGDIHTSPA